MYAHNILCYLLRMYILIWSYTVHILHKDHFLMMHLICCYFLPRLPLFQGASSEYIVPLLLVASVDDTFCNAGMSIRNPKRPLPVQVVLSCNAGMSTRTVNKTGMVPTTYSLILHRYPTNRMLYLNEMGLEMQSRQRASQ